MLRNIYKQSTAWVTHLRTEARQDAIVRARITTALLFVAFCALSFFVVGYFVDSTAREILSGAGEPGFNTEAALASMERIRWMARWFHIIVIALAAYLFMGLTLRPVQRSIEMQRRFIANISHELRTPLAVAKTEAEVALRGTTLSQAELVAVLQGSLGHINHISRVIQFLLILSDLRAPASRSLERSVSLESTVAAVQNTLADAIARKGVEFRLELEEPGASIKGNAVALEKMLLNLVKNAVAHTPQGGVVAVRLLRRQGRLTLEVVDTGSGVPRQDQANLFEPFYRGKNAVPGGSGLGLSIVKEVASLHGAKVTVTSTEGEGSTFSVVFRS